MKTLIKGFEEAGEMSDFSMRKSKKKSSIDR
jgi:hypothetical protein